MTSDQAITRGLLQGSNRGILNTRDMIGQLVQQRAQELMQPHQKKKFWETPEFGQAMLNLGATLAEANRQGMSVGQGLSLGLKGFGESISNAEKAQREANENKLADLRDLIGLQISQAQLGNYEREAARAEEERANREAAIAQLTPQQQILVRADPSLLDNFALPQERKIIEQNGVQYYADTGEPVLPNAPAASKDRKTAEDQNGVLRYVDTGEPVFPGVEKTPDEAKPSAEERRAQKLATEALSNFDTAKAQLFGENGAINKNVIPLTVAAPLGESRTFTQAMRRSIQNALYLKTGAAATKDEVDALLKQYMPSPLDNDEQIKNKMDSLGSFLELNAPTAAQPSTNQNAFGIDPAAIDAELKRRGL